MEDPAEPNILEYANPMMKKDVTYLLSYDRAGLLAFIGVLVIGWVLGFFFTWFFAHLSFPIAAYARRYARRKFEVPASIEKRRDERFFPLAMILVGLFAMCNNTTTRYATCRHGWSWGVYGYGITHTKTVGPCNVVVKEFWRIKEGWYLWRE